MSIPLTSCLSNFEARSNVSFPPGYDPTVRSPTIFENTSLRVKLWRYLSRGRVEKNKENIVSPIVYYKTWKEKVGIVKYDFSRVNVMYLWAEGNLSTVSKETFVPGPKKLVPGHTPHPLLSPVRSRKMFKDSSHRNVYEVKCVHASIDMLLGDLDFDDRFPTQGHFEPSTTVNKIFWRDRGRWGVPTYPHGQRGSLRGHGKIFEYRKRRWLNLLGCPSSQPILGGVGTEERTNSFWNGLHTPKRDGSLRQEDQSSRTRRLLVVHSGP